VADRIYKYKLTRSQMALPIGPSAKVLTAGLQDDEIVIWAIVDPWEKHDEHTGGRQFVVVNTGGDAHDDYRYINTLTTSNGIVWHVFEVGV